MKFVNKNYTYKNNEELYFSYYLDELKEKNLIESYEYETESFLLSDEITFDYTKTTVLKTKTKVENRTKALLHKHSYTPDFKIRISTLGFNTIFGNGKDLRTFIFEHGYHCYVDVKGAFGGRLSTSITFPLNQKWMYQKYSIYVQKVKPFTLFENTFMPAKVIEEMKYKRDYIKKDKLLAKKGDSKLDYKPKTIKEWIQNLGV